MNGHIGNERLRKMALERKSEFDSGTYTEKRKLATEIVDVITKTLSPPGRFLKKASKELIVVVVEMINNSSKNKIHHCILL